MVKRSRVRAVVTGVPGRGVYKGVTGLCIRGHLLEPNPNRPGMRCCFMCARLRSAEKSAALSAVTACLGMTYRAYTAEFGYGVKRALALLQECEQANARWMDLEPE